MNNLSLHKDNGFQSCNYFDSIWQKSSLRIESILSFFFKYGDHGKNMTYSLLLRTTQIKYNLLEFLKEGSLRKV